MHAPSTDAPTDGSGLVAAIHRGSLDDGPGLRTTVFLQGCHLRCVWCHNPETWSHRQRLHWLAEDCMACGQCRRHCGHNLHAQGPAAAPAGCTRCGACVEACPSGALGLAGRRMTSAEVMAAVERDAATLRAGGGLTLSGGEPLDQADFVLALLEASGRAGLNRCLDTSGDVPEQLIQQLLTVVDCWLLDWKCSDPERHRELTGVDNHRIRRTLARLGEAGARIWLRCPLVPGLNDDEGHLRSISALSRRYAIERIQVMPYHRHGAGKAAAAGRVIHQAPSATLAQRRTWLNTLQHCGCLNLYEGASP